MAGAIGSSTDKGWADTAATTGAGAAGTVALAACGSASGFAFPAMGAFGAAFITAGCFTLSEAGCVFPVDFVFAGTRAALLAATFFTLLTLPLLPGRCGAFAGPDERCAVDDREVPLLGNPRSFPGQ